MSAEPFSCQVVASDIPAGGREFHLEADAEQRRGLAERFGIPEVREFSADLFVRPVRGQTYTVRGTVSATVVQTCVVSLEPFTERVDEDLDVTLMRAEDVDPQLHGRDDLVDASAADGPEVFHRGRIDLGVIASEHLALGLDPYPRAPGVSFTPHIEDDTEAKVSPFAALAGIRDRKA